MLQLINLEIKKKKNPNYCLEAQRINSLASEMRPVGAQFGQSEARAPGLEMPPAGRVTLGRMLPSLHFVLPRAVEKDKDYGACWMEVVFHFHYSN